MSGMIDGIPPIRQDDRIGVSGKRPKGQFRQPAPPIGPTLYRTHSLMPCNGPAICLAGSFESCSSRWNAPYGESRLRLMDAARQAALALSGIESGDVSPRTFAYSLATIVAFSDVFHIRFYAVGL